MYFQMIRSMMIVTEKEKMWEILKNYGITNEEEFKKALKEVVVDIGIMTTKKSKSGVN